jgi:squalene-hopene/tetraprenyl-beta-curcumene cyclase
MSVLHGGGPSTALAISCGRAGPDLPAPARPPRTVALATPISYHPAAMPVDRVSLLETLTNARATLLAARGPHGHWEGELSSSALSTATAVFALHQVVERLGDRPGGGGAGGATGSDASAASGGTGLSPGLARTAGRLIRQGLGWLALNQNADGGWGDTTASFSNISTTCLCWAAFVADENWAAGAYDKTLRACEQWLIAKVGTLDPKAIAKAIVDRYGEDHTFSVPILTMCAMAGRLGLGREAWDLVPPLPFELAAFPPRLFKWLKLPVVSYALPALIAIGQVRHALRPSTNGAVRMVRDAARGRTLKLLSRIQPPGGGFLEATPLTSFVVMSLAAAGKADHSVVARGVEFLVKSARDDGSFPIDTNLATWVTTLAVNALAAGPDFDTVLPEAERKPIRDWLLGQQYRVEHPYTLADPGGWAWTDLPGGVPDADDTPGALLALKHLGPSGDAATDARVRDAAAMGVKWLLGLQNRDGGIPTFCKGWGTLPFDKSSADLTAHTLRAFGAWHRDLPQRLRPGVQAASVCSANYLARVQREDGSWLPLWFGNQHAPDDENPLYGTTRVLRERGTSWAVKRGPAVNWLLAAQLDAGGWGGAVGTGPATVEETALAVETLANLLLPDDADVKVPRSDDVRAAVARGVAWLVEHTHRGTTFPPSPIGFYFAKLWYWEALYPLVWTVGALGQAARALDEARGTSNG